MTNIDNGIKTIIENCGNTMFVKFTSGPVLCTIVGWGIQENRTRPSEDELYVLAYKQKSNGVDFPIVSLKNYTIVNEINNAVKEQYTILPFSCVKIFKNKMISCFV